MKRTMFIVGVVYAVMSVSGAYAQNAAGSLAAELGGAVGAEIVVGDASVDDGWGTASASDAGAPGIEADEERSEDE